MLILIEGPDCSRKSTLATRLDARLRALFDRDTVVETRHLGPPTGHPLDEYELPLLDYEPARRHHVVCDRWHLGELVYPGVLDRPSRLDDAVFHHIELLLRSRGALLVVITPDETELRACLVRRGDDPAELERVAAVREGYVRAASRTSLPLLWLKDEEVDEDLTWLVIEQAQLHEQAATALASLTTYVGPPEPRLLLLGDVRATGATPGDPRPAFMPYSATSGHYLLTALGDAITEHQVGLANACDVDDPGRLWRRVGRPPTVALGRNAQRAVTWAVRDVPHPQWTRRFRYHDGESYRRQILGE